MNLWQSASSHSQFKLCRSRRLFTAKRICGVDAFYLRIYCVLVGITLTKRPSCWIRVSKFLVGNTMTIWFLWQAVRLVWNQVFHSLYSLFYYIICLCFIKLFVMMAASNANSNHSSAHLSKSNTTFATTKTTEQSNSMDIEQLQHMINCTVKVCLSSFVASPHLL